MPFAEAGGAKIYYEQHGSGPAVMLIHGSGGHHMAWGRQVAYLARWFTVLTIDLHGFGNSTPLEGGPPRPREGAGLEARRRAERPHSLYWEMPEVFNATVHQLLNEVYGMG
jgi:pimeloyl-ACP methyl ester carboxylesterase